MNVHFLEALPFTVHFLKTENNDFTSRTFTSGLLVLSFKCSFHFDGVFCCWCMKKHEVKNTLKRAVDRSEL